MSEPTKVVFRKYPEDGEIIALFPEIPAHQKKWWLCRSYQSVGQHGQACYDWVVLETEPATHDEYQGLLKELREQGYENLKCYQRRTPQMIRTMQDRWDTLNER